MSLTKYLAAIDKIGNGERNAGLYKVGLTLRGTFALQGDALLDALKSVNSEKCLPPLDDVEVERIAKSVDSATKVPCENSEKKKTKTKTKKFSIQLGETVDVAPLLETKIGVFNTVKETTLNGTCTIGEYLKAVAGAWENSSDAGWRQHAEYLRLCREAAAAGDVENKNKYKYLLKAVAPCCVPKNRTKGTIQEQNGIFLLDVDGLTADNIETEKQRLAALPFVFATGVSASGLGLWALCVLETKTDLKVLLETLNNAGLGFTFDKSCSDAGRLRFLTRDAGVIVKNNVQKVGLVEAEAEAAPVEQVNEKSMAELFNETLFYRMSGQTKILAVENGRLEPVDKATAYNLVRNEMPGIPLQNGNGTRHLTDMEIDVLFSRKERLAGIITTGTAPAGLVREMDGLYYNKGYAPVKDLRDIEPASEEEIKLFIQNLGHVVGFDLTAGKQVLKFVSEIVKNPLDPAKMTKRQLVIQNADTGTGKDLLFTILLRKLYGYNGAYLIGSDAENVLGGFNGNLAGKIGFRIGEMKSMVQGGNLKISFEKMKQYDDGMFDTVTKGKMAEKHRDPVFMILTSNEDCLPPTSSTSRRGLFLGTDSKNDKFGTPTGNKLGREIAALYESEAGARILKTLSQLDDMDVDMGAIEDRSGEWKYAGILKRLISAAQRKQPQHASFGSDGNVVDITLEYKSELKELGHNHSKRLREYMTLNGLTVNIKRKPSENFDRVTAVTVDLTSNELMDDETKDSNFTVKKDLLSGFTDQTQTFIDSIFKLFTDSKDSKFSILKNKDNNVVTTSTSLLPCSPTTSLSSPTVQYADFTVFTVNGDVSPDCTKELRRSVNENTGNSDISSLDPVDSPQPEQQQQGNNIDSTALTQTQRVLADYFGACFEEQLHLTYTGFFAEPTATIEDTLPDDFFTELQQEWTLEAFVPDDLVMTQPQPQQSAYPGWNPRQFHP